MNDIISFKNPVSRYCYYLHFTERNLKAQRGEVLGLRSHSQQGAEGQLESRGAEPKVLLLTPGFKGSPDGLVSESHAGQMDSGKKKTNFCKSFLQPVDLRRSGSLGLRSL